MGYNEPLIRYHLGTDISFPLHRLVQEITGQHPVSAKSPSLKVFQSYLIWAWVIMFTQATINKMSVPYCFYAIVGNNFTWMETNFCNCNTITFSAHDSVFWRRMYFIKNNQKLCHFIHRSVDTLLCSIRFRIKGFECRQRVSFYLVMKCWPGHTNCMGSHTPAILSTEL